MMIFSCARSEHASDDGVVDAAQERIRMPPGRGGDKQTKRIQPLGPGSAGAQVGRRETGPGAVGPAETADGAMEAAPFVRVA